MLHIYYGYGKGKTSSALGLSMRMAGYGREVLFIQFLKDGSSGEILSARRLPEFRFLHPSPYLSLAGNRRLWERVLSSLTVLHEYGMVVLDEALDAMTGGAMTERELLDAVDACERTGSELVITGHETPPPLLLERADYLTRFEELKHPFSQGIEAREGIEF